MAGEAVRIRIEGDPTHAVAAMQRVSAQSRIMSGEVTRAGTAAAGASSQFAKMRGPLTSVAQGFLQLTPGVSSAVSVLGSLAIGGGLMAGVLLGLSALAAGWSMVTKGAREAKQAQEEAAQAARSAASAFRMGQSPLGATAGNLAAARATEDAARFDFNQVNTPWNRARDPGAIAKAAAALRRAKGDTQTLEQQQRDILMGGNTLEAIEGVDTSRSDRRRAQEEAARKAAAEAERQRIARRNRDITSRDGGMSDGSIRRGVLGANIEMGSIPFRDLNRTYKDGRMVGRGLLDREEYTARAGGGFNRDQAISAGINGLTSIAAGGSVTQGLFSTAAGVASSFGGPVGMVAGGVISALGAVLGNGREQEERMRRAHLAALREARQDTFNFTIVIPKGYHSPSDPDWKENMALTLTEISGTNTGRVSYVEAA